MTRLLRGLTAMAGVAIVTAAGVSAQSGFTQEELTVSPYALAHGTNTIAQRIDRHRRLAAIAEQSADYARAARHFGLACTDHSMFTGDATLGDRACTKARALAETHGVVDVTVSLKNAVALIAGWQSGVQNALTTVREAIVLGSSLNPDNPDHFPINSSHHILGVILLETGQFDAARRELNFSRDHSRTAGMAGAAAWSDLYLCRLHTMLGDFPAARAACDTAAAEIAVDNDLALRTNLAWMRGTLYAFTNRPAASLAELQKSWELSQIRGNETLQPILPQLMTDALIKLGRLDEAERLQTRVEQALKAGTIPVFFGPQIAMRRAQLAVAHGQLDTAEAAFNSASRSFIHEMSIRGHLGAAGVARVRGNFAGARQALETAIRKIEAGRTNVSGSQLRTNYLTMHANAFRELIRIRFDAEGAAAAPAILEIAEAARARGLRDALASAQVAGAAAPAITATEVQRALAADEALIEYVSSRDRLLAITVTPSTIAVTPLLEAGNEATLTQRVEFFYSLAQEGDEAALAPAAKRLYDDILAPAIASLPTTTTTLIVAADGPLHRLPFDALGDGERVIDRWNVVSVPSAAALVGRTAQALNTPATLIVAAPATGAGLPPLIAAPEEAAAIRGRVSGNIAELSGTVATKARLQKEPLDRFSVLHFASHAVVDEERPLLSSLVLANDNGVQGRWTAEEIYRSKLKADLVVLSACSTAAGATEPGEGVMSLSRAFLYAGARATIATLWNIPDAPGPVFADVLYRELAGGAPLGAAAAQARRELRRRGAPPRVWSAYVVTGDPGTRVGITARTSPRLITAGVSGAAAIFMLIAAIVIRAAGTRSRIRWTVLASTAAIFAVVAIGAPLWPADSYGDLSARTQRGEAADTIRILVSRGSVSWPAVAAADEHAIELFNEAGLPAGTYATAVSPFTLPSTEDARWVRVIARRDGQAIAQSPLVRLTREIR